MQTFAILSNEIGGRIDPFYYRPEFYELERQLDSLKWKIVKLSDIFEINRGGSPRPINKFFTTEENGINWIKIGDTKGVNKYIYKTNQKIKPEGVKFSREVKEGDFILSNSMSFGRPYIMKTKGCIHDGWLLLREKDKNLNKEFLYYLLSTNFIYRFFKRATLGGVVENLNIDLVKEIRVPIPSLEIQNKIVSLMDKAYSSKKSKETEALNLLESINYYIFDELGIKPPELEDKMTYVVNSDEVKSKRIDVYYFLPKFEEVEKAVNEGNFEVKEIRDHLNILNKLENIENYDFINYVDLASINKNLGLIKNYNKLEIEEAPSRAKQKIEKGDLLLSSLVGSLKSTAIFDGSFDNAICSTGFYVIKNSKNYNNYYLWALFRSDILQMLLQRESSGAIMSAINRESLSKLKIPLPPLSVQNKIADEVKKRMQKAEQLQKEAKEELEKAKLEVERIILG